MERTSSLAAVHTPPEAALLLGAARTFLGTAGVEHLRPLLRDDLDWDAVLQWARRHGVLPLLYRSLATTCADAIPQVVLQELRQQFRMNAHRLLALAGALRTLLRQLESHGIPALPYKGPVLAATVYGDVTLRQCGDLDILVRHQDARRAEALLLAQGYRAWGNRPHSLFPRYRKVCELISADGQVLVDLHWAITSATFRFPLTPAQLWQRLETISFLETPVRSLAPEDLLLILCVHGSKHCWGRLGWICDVAALLRPAPQLDWEHVVAQVRKLGVTRMLGLGLRLAHDLLGPVLPPAVWHWMQTDAMVSWLAAQVRRRLFTATTSLPIAWDHPAFYVGLRERVQDRLLCHLYLAYRRSFH